MQEDESYDEMSDRELGIKFNEWIEEYREWLDKEVPLNEDWSEEVHYMVFMRNEIHLVVTEILKRTLQGYDFRKVKSLDEEWLQWIAANSPNDLKLYNSRKSTPKSHWWWWIDQLSTLTDNQKATL